MHRGGSGIEGEGWRRTDVFLLGWSGTRILKVPLSSVFNQCSLFLFVVH